MMLGWLAAPGPVRHRTTAARRPAEWIERGRDGGDRPGHRPGRRRPPVRRLPRAVLRRCAIPADRRGALTPMVEGLVEQALAGLSPR
ncbi:hypothetical protein DMP15_04450 [Pseudonocardia sp. UM4_GMWB1]|uniref:Uncharacterized protein n=1 Tax=Pseudonocardia alni TaxID=33907 RepID=A0A852W363_PSEA5|nr:hypothetical protein [Pseudonocardia antarctica]